MKLIKLPEGYIITSDEKPDVGQKYFSTDFRLLSWLQEFENEWGYEKEHKPNLALASTFHTELPQIEFDLSDEDAKKIGWVDIEKFAKDYYLKNLLSPHHGETTKNDYKNCIKYGFQKAQSLSDKMFSLEELKTSCINFAEHCKSLELLGNHIHNYKELLDDSLSEINLSQPKQWNIEVEMEKEVLYTSDGLDYKGKLIPKITNGKLKITKIL